MATTSAGATSAAPPARTALTHVRVFDGRQLTAPRTVVIDGSVIGTDRTGAEVIDADGAVLLPGLIDAHIHLDGGDNLRQLRSFGVTTALDMATWQPGLVTRLRRLPAATDIRSAGTPVVGDIDPDTVPGVAPELVRDAIVRTPHDAGRGVTARVEQGSDYIKIMLGPAGPGAAGSGLDQPTVDAVVAAAHAHRKKVVAHALTTDAYQMAIHAGVDVITHVPLDQPLEPEQVSRIVSTGAVCVPTLTMMEGVAALADASAFDAASRSVTALHQARVPILAGTDANALPGVPVHVQHGQSIHHELELLVAAGLSTTDALRAATNLPAHHFGLTDRGAVQPGLRADLILIDGDPTTDIRTTSNILHVWCGGTPHNPASTN